MLVAVLGSFQLLHAGHVVTMSPGAERLLAFVALHSQPVARLVVAGTLWSPVSGRRAYSTMRSSPPRPDPAARRAGRGAPRGGVPPPRGAGGFPDSPAPALPASAP